MSARTRSPLLLAALVAVLAVGLQALLVPLFAAPAANLAPRDLPVAVAGPAPVAGELAGRLAAVRPAAFAVTTVADAAAADRALRDREVYAALVAGEDGISLHTASAAAPAVAALLTEAAGQLSAGRPVPVVDVVPGDPDDPRGAGFAAGFLPLALASMLAGVLLTLLVQGRAGRLVGLVAYGALAGPVGAAVLHGWLGVIDGDRLAEVGAIGLFATAAAATVAGLGALLGRVGLGLGAVLVFLVGNPLSAVGAAPELLPQPWGEIGQWLPVGAGATLLRSAAYFDGAGGGRALAVLTGYAVVGVALVLLHRGGRRPAGAGEATSPGRAG
ncbi:hypothetical protein [Micromonospora endolithica]|uniref:ABC transporter permease n=1 Tax=Micromonospora endolithica TaxID=230091 RepID=A0A3A9Z5L2_9ACTN|nr:hypothetical protein [Micromonospora endolithica]RKN43510.1 hypothetical protein D7223_20955 [Micromonospora endolithica]TWJ24098.1 hypothetical protein JD76_04244 [Micromonospora endolithica]